MKQCSTCNRTYSDDTLAYCLEDGSLLIQTYDPQATHRIPAARATDLPLTQAAPGLYHPAPQPAKSRWPIYLAITLVVLVLGAGAVALLLIFFPRSPTSSSSANTNGSRPMTTESSPTTTKTREAAPASDEQSPSPTIQARQFVGVWRANVHEDNDDFEITYTFTADGRTRMFFKRSDGKTGSDYGTWQYSDGILFERFSNGAAAKSSIRWMGDDHFELTIIDNGVPSYAGVKRRFSRVQ